MRRLLPVLLTLLVLISASGAAERLGYPASEFTARRKALAQSLGSGLVLLCGRTIPPAGIRFRQDNDFYYLTGSEDVNAVLVMDAATSDSWLFLPEQGAGEIRSDGKNWLSQGDQAKERGYTAIRPLNELTEFLVRRRGGFGVQALWTRLSERDEVDDSRDGVGISLARNFNNPLGGQPSEDAWRASLIRERYPYYDLKDLTPAIDKLRVIKSPREIEALKVNGRLSAEAIQRAMAITKPGRFEYELEAEATYHLFRNGVQGNGYESDGEVAVGCDEDISCARTAGSHRLCLPGTPVGMEPEEQAVSKHFANRRKYRSPCPQRELDYGAEVVVSKGANLDVVARHVDQAQSTERVNATR